MYRSVLVQNKHSWQMVSITQVFEKFASKSVHFYKLISIYYRSIIRREIALAGISSADHVLFIGGGPCPCSAIMIHEITGARVTVVDYDVECINCSHKLICMLGYEKSIQIICKHGCEMESFESSPYTIVLMAAQVDPVDEVFSHIKTKCSNGTKILIRLPKNKLKNRYHSAVHRDLFEKFPRTLHASINNLESTSLYVKTDKTLEMDRPSSPDHQLNCLGEAI